MAFHRTGPLTPAQLDALRTVDTRLRDAEAERDAESRTHAVAICLALGLIVPRDIHVPDTARQRTRGAAA